MSGMEPGYYWVRYCSDEWQPGRLVGDRWFLCGEEEPVGGAELDEIGPRLATMGAHPLSERIDPPERTVHLMLGHDGGAIYRVVEWADGARRADAWTGSSWEIGAANWRRVTADGLELSEARAGGSGDFARA